MRENCDYPSMSNEDLMKELDRLAEEMADLELEREYLLLRTNVHVSGSSSKSTETALSSLSSSMHEIKEILKKRGFGARMLAPDTEKKP